MELEQQAPRTDVSEYVIRRKGEYNNGSQFQTYWFEYNNLLKEFRGNRNIGDGIVGLQLNPNAPIGVYDSVAITLPEIDFGRCV